MRRLPLLFVVLLPALLLIGCRDGTGKVLLDGTQVLLQQKGWERWLFCVLLVIALWQLVKLLRGTWRITAWLYRELRKMLFRWSFVNLSIAVITGTILWAFSGVLSDLLQEVEQRFFYPVWLNQYDDVNEERLTAIYEAELARHTDAYELEVVKRRTREIAQKIQSTPLAIYECAWLECGLNPFTVRKDQVAAGWIQFTRVGLSGIRHEGQAVSFDQVLYACKRRDIQLMMNLTEIYLTTHYHIAGERPLNNTIDLYLALFAPASIGAPHNKVIYQGRNNPAYYLNKGLDGWYITQTGDGRQQIFRKEAACDGAITIWEMYLALEAKKDRLVSTYLNK